MAELKQDIKDLKQKVMEMEKRTYRKWRAEVQLPNEKGEYSIVGHGEDGSVVSLYEEGSVGLPARRGKQCIKDRCKETESVLSVEGGCSLPFKRLEGNWVDRFIAELLQQMSHVSAREPSLKEIERVPQEKGGITLESNSLFAGA